MTHLDIPYKTLSDGSTLCGDVFLPPWGAGSFPVLFYWHGGGWTHGTRTLPQFMLPFVEALHRHGVALVSLSYRLTGRFAPAPAFPTLVHDALDGLRFFLQNAVSYALDPARFALFGVSAGAHLALLAGLAGDFFGESLPKTPCRPACILDFCGPTDFHSRAPVANQVAAGACVSALLGGFDEANNYLVSPAAYACAAPYLPPIFAVHGQADEMVHKTQPETLQKIYAARGASFTLLPVENGSHAFGPVAGLPAPSPAYPDIFAASLRFLLKHLS